MGTSRFALRAATLVALVVSATHLSLGQVTEGTRAGDSTYADFKLFQKAHASALDSFGASAQCRSDVDKLVELYSDPVSGGFIAAKLAWLLGRPSSAIAILEKLVSDDLEGQKARSGYPVPVEANFWIGTISRHFGDAQRARRAYADIARRVESDKDLNGLAALSYLYDAEIQCAVAGNTAGALESLEKARQVPPPVGTEGQPPRTGYDLFQQWVDYQTLAATKGVKEARPALKGSADKTNQCVLLAIGLLEMDGISAEPRIGFHGDEGQILLYASLDSAVECRTSPIDKSLAQLLVGWLSEKKQDAPTAEKRYGDLFAGESYFAPEGGVHLARLQKKQGKAAEAAKTLAEIKERFPGYAEYVDELSREPAPVPQAAVPKAKPEPPRPSRLPRPPEAKPGHEAAPQPKPDAAPVPAE